ncbi:MAG: 2-hydroxyacyl-CoA dehydratase subunit D [Candidatus Thorarchaeota archaeon]
MSFPEVIETSNQVLQALVDAGERVLGYIYPHPPHEVLIAHGLKPSLVRTNPLVVGAYEASLQTFSCSLTRNLFSQRASSSFPLLAGIVFSGNTCDALQNVGDVWRKRFPEDKVLRLTYPVGDAGESSIEFLAMEIKSLSDDLETLYGVPFSESAFKQAAQLLREIRDVLQLLYSVRLLYPFLISYNVLSNLVGELLTAPTEEVSERLKGMWMEVAEKLDMNQTNKVEQLRESLLNRDLSGFASEIESSRPRIAVIGGMIEPGTFSGLVDDIPGFTDSTLVLDMLSFGFKTVFTPPVNNEGDPYVETARSILGAHSEPTQEGLPKRVAFLKDVLTRLSIQGLIVCEQSFCDPDEFESPSLEKAAEEVGVPTVKLPLDSELSDRARIEGRIQTFLETIDAK